MANVFRRTISKVVDRVVRSLQSRQEVLEKTSPGTKIALRNLYLRYREMAERRQQLPAISETGFRVFSQFEEDGIILFLLGAAGIQTAKFVDIGSGDGTTGSNCANLALNLGFHGLFIDADAENVRRGREFYAAHPDTSEFPPVFVHTLVTMGNINQVINDAGFAGEIDVLSIDIDGNDYWIWKAIERVSPRIVVIETHVEFGMRSIVVPYDEKYVWHPGVPPSYLGASVIAMTKLANSLGYRLVGANRFGFNTVFLRSDLAQGLIPEIEPGRLLEHDRNRERAKLFDAIEHLPYEVVE